MDAGLNQRFHHHVRQKMGKLDGAAVNWIRESEPMHRLFYLVRASGSPGLHTSALAAIDLVQRDPELERVLNQPDFEQAVRAAFDEAYRLAQRDAEELAAKQRVAHAR